jgi:hypothetical protein
MQPKQKSVIALWGLSGVGKSHLASEFVDTQRSRHPHREIFWINADSREACESSIEQMFQADHRPNQAILNTAKDALESRRALVDFFFAKLQSEKYLPWLLIVDNISTRSIPQLNRSVDGHSFDIHKYIRNVKCGAFILISSRKEYVEGYPHLMEIRGLETKDAVTILKHEIDHRFTEDEGEA